MSRTRGASQFHQDDGVVLDKEGKPIPTGREEAIVALETQSADVVTPPPAPPEPIGPIKYRCNKHTWQRDMDGYEAVQLLDILLGGLAAELDFEDWAKLPADVRRHWRRTA